MTKSILSELQHIVASRLNWDSDELSASLSNPTPAIFILTPPRSGSTLLRVMLGGHPELFAPPELELLSFSNLGHRREGLSVRHDYMLKGLVRAVMALRDCTETEAEALVAEWEAQTTPTPAVYAQLQAWCGTRMLVDKSVHYPLSPAILQRAENCFEQARYIHLTRHPQATMKSIVSLGIEKELFGGGVKATPMEIAEGIWTLSHQNILNFLAHVPAGRQLRIRFEDLVSAPQAELERICAFLGLEFHAAMLSPYEESQQRMTDGLGAQDPNFHRHSGIDARMATAWRQDNRRVGLLAESAQLATGLRYWDLGRESCPAAEVLQHSNLSIPQLSRWLAQQRDTALPATYDYLSPLPGTPDATVFVQAFNAVVAAHPLLCQSLVHRQGIPYWQAGHCPEVPLIELGSDQLHNGIAQIAATAGTAPQFALFHLADGSWHWWLRLPAILFDKAGASAFISQTLARYQAYMQGTALEAFPHAELDTPQTQRQTYLESAQYAEDLAAWREYPASSLTNWYGRHSRPGAVTIRHHHLALPVDGLFNQDNTEAALVSALVIYLRTICQSPLINLGLTVTETSSAIGRHQRILPLSIEWDNDEDLAQLQARIETQIQQTDAQTRRLPLVNSPVEPIYRVLLEIEKDSRTASEPAPLNPPECSPYIMTLQCRHEVKSQTLHCDLYLDCELFPDDLLPLALGHFAQAIGCLDNPHARLGQVSLLTAQDQQLLRAWNDTVGEYRQDLSVVALFEQQAAIRPDNIAVVFEDETLTYRQLNAKANQFARYILSLQGGHGSLITNNSLIAICVERSPAMVVGLLAILKAGGAYVPIDPAYPVTRIQYLLEDSAVPLLLSQKQLINKLPVLAHDCAVVSLDEVELSGQSEANLDIQRNGDDLAYVIYTSGSTGMPKGVMVGHQAFALHCQAIQQQYVINENDKVLQFASMSFDASLEQLFIAWLNGASSILVKTNTLIAADLLAFLHTRMVSVADIPPAYWQQVLDTENLELPYLRILILGGEALPVATAQQTVNSLPSLACFNAYGPTEAVITPTVYRLPAQLADVRSIPIGRPRANTRIYILNAQHQQQAPGVPGELCIAGAGLADGYLNRPELTAEKFIDIEIFGTSERIYKTGDLARWLPNGNLEYLGRIDHQVKLRGFRIELGEIEAILTQYEAVKEAVVTLYEESDSNKRLIAYITTEDGNKNKEGLIAELRTWLKSHLPDYMVPAQFMVLEQMPLTPGGKIDRKALLTVEIESAVSAKPITVTEELVASLWSDVLKVEAINRDDNFFELGGHSLLATLLVARIRDSFQVELPVHQLFESPVLSDLAAWLDQQQGGEVLPPIEPQPEGAAKIMSYDQQAFWLRSQLDQQASVHNMRHAVRLRGPLNVPAMRQALQQVMERQAGLRFYFPDANTIAYCHAQDLLEFSDLSHLSEAEQTLQIRRIIQQQTGTTFNLRQGPLLRLHLAQLGRDTHVLLLAQHHMLGDAWSLAIWEREWQAFYLAQCQSTSPKLPPLPIQYTDYAAWQRHYLSAERLAKLENYWLDLLQDAPELLRLPTDYPRPMRQQGYGRTYEMNITPELRQALRQVAPQHNCTLFMLLFSAFNVLLYRFSGQTDLCVGVPMVNRHHAETQNLIGIFLNILPMRTRLDGAESFTHLLAQVRHHSLEVQTHASLPFANLLPKLKPAQQQSYNPYFQIMFNWATAPDEEVEASELRLEPYRDPLSEHERAISNLDIVVALIPTPNGGINIRWVYDTALFKAETIELLANSYQYLLEQVVEQPDKPVRQFTLTDNAQTALYPLTLPQRAIWLDQVLHDGIPLYNIGGQVHLPGPLNVERFRQAVNLLLQKHDNLRLQLTKNRDENGIPQQTIVMPFNSEVALHDFRAEANPREAAQQWMQQRFIEPFALEGESLFRYDLIQVADEEYYWLAQYHHLIIDGYGMALLNRSLADIYTRLATGEALNLDSPSYTNFIDNDRIYLDSPAFEKQHQYWSDKYAIVPEPLLNPMYRSQYTGKVIGSGCEELYLSRDFYDRLNRLAMRNRTTLFSVLLGVLYVYFTRTAQRDDFVIGLPMLNRVSAQFDKNEQLAQISGLFTGVCPTWLNLGKALTFAELLQKITQTLKANYSYQRFPVNEINRLASVGSEHQQLFDVVMSYENHDYDACFDGIHSKTDLFLHPWEQTPLTIFVRDFHAQADVKFDFVFNLAYFNSDDIKALQARFITILETVLKDSASLISTLPVMTEEESGQLQTWNNTAADYPRDKTVVELFEQQVEKTPDKLAVAFGEQHLTYQELNERVNQLAHYLLGFKQQAPLPDNPLIAIAVERCLEMPIGLLAILKAGGAYVPVDPTYPTARIQYLLEDSQAPLLLTQSHLQAQLPALSHECAVVCLDNADFAGQPNVNPALKSAASDLAYIIYTSGSTGKPKGVMLEHHGAVNLATFQHQYFKTNSDSRVLQFASLSFDAATWEMLMSLCSGAALQIVPLSDIQTNLEAVFRTRAITHATLPPSAAKTLFSNAEFSHLKYLAVAGEACSPELVKQWAQPGRHFINAYGPTESTVCASVFECLPDGRQPPIGKPIANTRTYILDAQHQLQPPGIPGELCIAGAGLARGYLNRPELTAEKFIEIELCGQRERIYKTGDLARWLPDGNLEYFGRIDFQVKLRGFRIELGEIETVLSQHESVEEAVVILYEQEGNKSLAAYITAADTITKASLPAAELREWLKNRLPDYMIPSSFTVLERLPLTPSGKIDRKALPAPAMLQSDAHHEPPSNEIEQNIANVWQRLLKLENPSIHASFFELGGHSLLAIQVHHALQADYPILKVVDLFTYPTIHALANYLNQNHDHEAIQEDQQLHQQRGEKRRTQRRVARQRKQ